MYVGFLVGLGAVAAAAVLLRDEPRERRAAGGARHVHGDRRAGGGRRQARRVGARQAHGPGVDRRRAGPAGRPAPVLLVRSGRGHRVGRLGPRRSAHDPVAGARGERREPGRRPGRSGRRDGRDRRRGVLHLHGQDREPVRRRVGRRAAVGDHGGHLRGVPPLELLPGADLHGGLGGDAARHAPDDRHDLGRGAQPVPAERRRPGGRRGHRDGAARWSWRSRSSTSRWPSSAGRGAGRGSATPTRSTSTTGCWTSGTATGRPSC